jgi:hypothetical protein
MTVAEQVRAEERLNDQLEQYAGRWVAVLEHEVAAHAETLDELLEQIEAKEIEAEVFRVAEDSHAVSFY